MRKFGKQPLSAAFLTLSLARHCVGHAWPPRRSFAFDPPALSRVCFVCGERCTDGALVVSLNKRTEYPYYHQLQAGRLTENSSTPS